jgi:hypothetical protein
MQLNQLRIVVGVMVAGATFVVGANPAAAVRTPFEDTAGETDASSDITHVVVNNATTDNRVAVSAEMGNMIDGDTATLWLDTRPAVDGPEYKLLIRPESDGFTLRRVSDFTGNGTTVACASMRVRLLTGHDVTARWSVPRPCLGYPGAVRASVRGKYYYASTIVTDWAPGYHRFFPWVARG